jgi:uncharacterized membrane protein
MIAWYVAMIIGFLCFFLGFMLAAIMASGKDN